MKVLVIGYGSIGKRHCSVLQLLIPGIEIVVVTKQKLDNFETYEKIQDVIEIDSFNYFIISTETIKHFEQLFLLNDKVKDKDILVEKPIFSDFNIGLEKIQNRIYCGYNLRFHPIISELKEQLYIERILSISVICGQYLPSWRPDTDYRLCYSASKERGGGVVYDLSHELDYISWLCGSFVDLKSIGGKISNLEINSNDYASVIGITNKKTFVSIVLDYLSFVPQRKIVLNTDSKTFEADLVNNTLLISNIEVRSSKVFEGMDKNVTYKKMHEAILLHHGNDVATYEEAKKVIDTIKLIEDRNKEFLSYL